MSGPQDARGNGGPGGYAGDGVEVPAAVEPGTDESRSSATDSGDNEGAGGPGGYAGDGIEVPAHKA